MSELSSARQGRSLIGEVVFPAYQNRTTTAQLGWSGSVGDMPESGPSAESNVMRYSATREELLPFVPSTARRVLDVGCGTGGFGRTLRAHKPGLELWGIEPEPAAAAAARGVYDDVREGFFPDDRLELPLGRFDTVLMMDVLEHMMDPEAALEGARPLMTNDAVVVASIPNARHYSVWWPLVRRGEWTYTESGLMDRTHVRWFTRSSMEQMFTSCGWVVLSVVGINPVEPVGWKAKSLARLGHVMDDMFFIQFVVTARPPGALSHPGGGSHP